MGKAAGEAPETWDIEMWPMTYGHGRHRAGMVARFELNKIASGLVISTEPRHIP